MSVNMNLGDTPLIVAACQKHGLLRNEAAYVLATAFWETARTMEPVREAMGDSDQQSIARLDRAWSRGQLPWVSAPYWRDGWFGRGYVQLTHERNYANAGAKIGVDLVGDPSKALQPDIAAEILVRGMAEGWFTGRKLSDYFSLQESDYVGARRIVNGMDRAAAIAELARDYEDALVLEGYGVEPISKRPALANTRRDGTPPRKSILNSKTVVSQVGQWITAIPAGVWAWLQAEDPQVRAAIAIGLAVVLAAGAVVFRERLVKWADGDR